MIRWFLYIIPFRIKLFLTGFIKWGVSAMKYIGLSFFDLRNVFLFVTFIQVHTLKVTSMHVGDKHRSMETYFSTTCRNMSGLIFLSKSKYIGWCQFFFNPRTKNTCTCCGGFRIVSVALSYSKAYRVAVLSLTISRIK